MRARFIATPRRSTDSAPARLLEGRGDDRSRSRTVCEATTIRRRLTGLSLSSRASIEAPTHTRLVGFPGMLSCAARFGVTSVGSSSSGQRLRPTGITPQQPPHHTSVRRASRDCSLRRRQHSWCTRHPCGQRVRASPGTAMAPRHSEQVWARLGLSMLCERAKQNQWIMKMLVCLG